MREIFFILVENYALLAAWLISCLLPGIVLWGLVAGAGRTQSMPWPNPELALFFTVCAGLSLQILLLIILAVSNLLSPVPILAVLAGLVAGSVVALKLNPAIWEDFTRPFRLTGFEWLQILPVFLLILPWVLRPLGPPYGMDALTYHLPYARFYLEHGGLAVNETLRFPLHTHNINLLYAAALIRPGSVLPQMMHAAMGWLAVTGVYGMSRHWHNWFTGILTAAGVLLLKEFVHSFGYAYVDNGVLLFVTAAFLCMALWVDSRQRSLLWFCALFAGTAMGTKYQGALFTIPLGLMLLWFSKDVKLTARFAFLTGVFGLFWYLRSWVISGNPVHPFAGDLFGYYIWSAKELAAQIVELKSHGIDRTLLNFLLLPWKLYSESLRFNGYTGNGGVLVGVFMLSCLLIRWQKPFVRALQITCLAYLIFWFWSSQVLRYLMLITPLMSLAAVTAFAVFAEMIWNGQKIKTSGKSSKSITTVGKAFLFATLALLLGFGLQNLRLDRHRVPLTAQQQTEFLRREVPAYDLMLAASADPRIGMGPILQFRVSESRYFFPGTVVGDWMGLYGYKQFAHIGPTGYWEIDGSESLYQKVKERGIKAVAMHKHADVFWPQDIASYRDHFDIVLETADGVLMIPKQ